MLEEQTTLLEQGVIVLPYIIEHETYAMMVEALMMHPKPLKLYCRGGGGDVASAFAIIDLIREHGNVSGMLLGEANSSHGVIWAGCQKRYVYPNGVLGVHMPSQQWQGAVDSREAWLLALEMERYENQIAELYKSICSKEVDWKQAMAATGSSGMRFLDASWLIENGMALPISALLEKPSLKIVDLPS